MPTESILTFVCPFISQRELEGLFHWAHAIAGPSVQQQVHPVIEPDAGQDALRVDLHFQVEDPAEFRARLQQVLFANPPPVKVHAVSFVPVEVKKAPKRLYVFDMDSTLINHEVLDEIGREIGAYDRFAEITEAAMQGRLDFAQSLKARVSMLKGLFHERALDILPRITLSPGVENLIQSAQRARAHTMVVSGGFDFVLRHFQKLLGIDTIHAHQLLVDPDGLFEGDVAPPIIDGNRKRELVHQQAQALQLSPEEVIIIGDGANDIPMMSEAGTQVSFQGKDKLNQVVNTWILDRHFRWLRAML